MNHLKTKMHAGESLIRILLIITILSGCIYSCSRDKGVIITGNTVAVKLPEGELKLTVCNPSMLHVTFLLKGKEAKDTSLAVINRFDKPVPFSTEETAGGIRIRTAELIVAVNTKNGHIQYMDTLGKVILSETPGSRKLASHLVNGEKTCYTEQGFDWYKNEGLYGLGQHQKGLMNYRGSLVRLVQDNSVVAVPVLMSSRGYGLIWDNYSLTEFRDTLMRHSPVTDSICTGSFWSEAGDKQSYYFMYGPALDKVVAQYRQATGAAPLYGKWAYGLWQCKEHYHTQKELLEVVREYRKRGIPLDNIVQDWYYWEPLPWGSHNFDRSRYPDPAAMLKELHENYNTHAMVSVWARFSPGSPNYDELNKAGFLFPASGNFGNGQYYDAYNPKAREMYWKQIHDSLYVKGFDAWWLDATEPEIGDLSKDKYKNILNNHLGSGAEYLNSYPLMTTMAVYQGQRKLSSDRRAYILTRSAFTGQQRNAATTWSGDIIGTWEVFRKQIAAGINFCYTGIPYWTSDIGGFFVSDFIGGNKNEEYRELFTRWFQFGAFCPVFRVHGTSTPREMYYFGAPGDWAYDAQLEADKLRYRLLPYIYSMAAEVTFNGYSMMRGLNFDFMDDPRVRNIADEYMFGPSFLVCPVTEAMYHKDFKNLSNESMIIPAANLKSESGESGLKVEYYKGVDLNRKIAERTDSCIDFTWNLASPLESLPVDSFSIRWTGQIVAPESGESTFITYADDGVRLWVGNKLVIDDWTQHDPSYRSGNINLVKGQKYPFKLEFKEVIGGANISLRWVPLSRERENARKLFEAGRNTTKCREVYLPANTGWYDFWTGRKYAGGKMVSAPAPMNQMPLFVRAGSIIPMGPVIQYASERAADPLEIRIYPGADGSFSLYEDENDNYNYEAGAYTRILFQWDDANRKLEIGRRQGNFRNMPVNRTFRIVKVSDNGAGGLNPVKNPDIVIAYDGHPLTLQLK